TAKLPLNPGGRFSFSPMIRSPLNSSTSLTAVASLLSIWNVNPPAGGDDFLTLQPSAAVALTATGCGSLPFGESSAALPGLPRTESTAHADTAAPTRLTKPNRRRPIVTPSLPGRKVG